MEPTPVLIRVDACEKIGFGHLMRCLRIADYLKSVKRDATFLTRFKDVRSSVEKCGYEIELIDVDRSVEDELAAIESLKSRSGIDIMILDVNNYWTFKEQDSYLAYLEGLKGLGLFLVSFEDLKVHPFISDIVIIPYVEACKLKLDPGIKCKCLLGPRYFVLHDEFLNAKKLGIRDSVDNILISMGGSDPGRITVKVLSALNSSFIEAHLTIVIGDFCNISDSHINKVLDKYKGTYLIYRNVGNMAEIMSNADIAILNSGLTKYEAAAVGLPCIVVSNNLYHSQLMRYFEEYGSAVHLGEANVIGKEHISAAVIRLINNHEMRRKMSESGKSLIDGGGTKRIVYEIENMFFLNGRRNS